MSLPEPAKLVGPRFRSPWTDDETTELKRRFADGETAREIARGMGLYSRNQVIGRLWRLGLTKNRPKRPTTKRSSLTENALTDRLRKARIRKKHSPLTLHSGEWKSHGKSPQGVMDDLPPFEGAKRVSIWDLQPGDCRWPMWGSDRKPYDFDATVYCGCKALRGLLYCAHHQEISFGPSRKVNTWLCS